MLCDGDDSILIADRSRAKSMREYWEFPGGKVREGEDAETALRRELQEELGITIAAPRYFQSVQHDYPDVQVEIDFFLVNQWFGAITGQEGQALDWVLRSELQNACLLPADIPVVAALQKLSKC